MSIVVTSNQPKEAAAPTTGSAVPKEVKTTPAAAATPAENLEASGASNEIETPESEGDGAGENQASGEKPKAKNGYKKRIDKLSKRAADAEQRASYLQGLLDAKKPSDGKAAEVKVEEPKVQARVEGEPDPDSFGSHAEYLKALTKWEIAEDKKAAKAAEESTKLKTEAQKAGERLQASVESFKESHKDWDDVVTDEFPVTPVLGRAILDSENPAQLMYELCKDKEAYDKIVALPEAQLIRALGRFEAKFEAQVGTPVEAAPALEEKPVSKAPPPISPVGNKGTGAGKRSITDPNISQKEYEALRAEQRKARSASW